MHRRKGRRVRELRGDNVSLSHSQSHNMAGKKKKKGARPGIAQQDSLRKDIEESKSQTLSALSEGGTGEEDAEGLDIADQLLATLDARDKATQEQLTPTAHSNSSQRRTSNLSGTSGQSQTSLSQTSGVSTSSPVKGAAEKIVHAGEKLFGNHSSETASALQPSVDGESSEDLQNKGHFKSLFTSSGSKTGSAGFPDGLKKTSRQKARKVSLMELCEKFYVCYSSEMKFIEISAEQAGFVRFDVGACTFAFVFKSVAVASYQPTFISRFKEVRSTCDG